MVKIVAVAISLGIVASSVVADVTVKGSAAVQITKKAKDYSEGNIDDSWSRGEVKVAGKQESGLSGLVHLRAEPKMNGATKGVDLQPRQIYFKLPVSIVEFTVGRWYEVYANSNSYFGRFLHGVNPAGSGSMNTNYNVLDGAKAALNFESIKSHLQIGVLSDKSPTFDHARILAMFGGSPVEGLSFSVGGNFDVVLPDEMDSDEAQHRAALNCAYTLVKDLEFKLFGEAAVTNFEEASDNAWFMLGATTAIPDVLDRVQVEFEIKNHRNDAPDSENNLCWMLLLRKKAMGLTFDLNVGADQKSLGSKTPDEIGVIFRTSAKF